jgi:hypothetical protein
MSATRDVHAMERVPTYSTSRERERVRVGDAMQRNACDRVQEPWVNHRECLAYPQRRAEPNWE